jgi:hypothetical protein
MRCDISCRCRYRYSIDSSILSTSGRQVADKWQTSGSAAVQVEELVVCMGRVSTFR